MLITKPVITHIAPNREEPITGNKGSCRSSEMKQEPALTQTEKDIFFAPDQATGRPQSDHRTAEQIITANRIFNNLPSSIPKENLYKHLGDWTSNNPDPQKRADAAYNAARVFNYIDGINVKESARTDNTKGNGRIEGEYESPLPPPFDEVTIDENSEAALLKKFSEEGYAVLDNHGTPLASDNEKITTNKPVYPTGRPNGDTRSAEQIFNANPIVNRFVESLAEHPYRDSILNNLKALTGDWTEDNKDDDSRADAAYNISSVANYIDAHPGFHRLDEGYDNIGPDHLTGFSRTGTNPNTEASALIDFSQNGYRALPD